MSLNKKILIGIGCFIAFIVLVVLVALKATSGLVDTIDKQLAALRQHDYVAAYSYTSKDFQSATSLHDFNQFVDAYPSLRKNKSHTFTTREIKNNIGIVKGTLYSIDGAATPVVYHLIKENGTWKILGIEVNPAGVSVEEANTSDESSSAASDDSSSMKTYDNKESKYTINYPANWDFELSGKGTILFSGKANTPSYYSTVNIQTVLTKKTGGDFSTLDQFMNDIKQQAIHESKTTKFLSKGQVEVANKDGTKSKGLFMVFTYTYRDHVFKQWQIVVLRADNKVFYAWAYTSPVEQYDSDYNVAETMLKSWEIY